MTSEQEPAHSLAAGTSFGVSHQSSNPYPHLLRCHSLKDESIVDKCPRTTTCSALTHVELLVISKSVSVWLIDRVEPLIMDTPNKGHLSIKDTCFDPVLILSALFNL